MPSIAKTTYKNSQRLGTIKSAEISALIANLNNYDGLARQKARNKLIEIGDPAVMASQGLSKTAIISKARDQTGEPQNRSLFLTGGNRGYWQT